MYKLRVISKTTAQIIRHYAPKNNISKYVDPKTVEISNKTNNEELAKIKCISYYYPITKKSLESNKHHIPVFEYVMTYNHSNYAPDIMLKFIVVFDSQTSINYDELTVKKIHNYVGVYHVGVMNYGETKYTFNKLDNPLTAHKDIENKFDEKVMLNVINIIKQFKDKKFKDNYGSFIDENGKPIYGSE